MELLLTRTIRSDESTIGELSLEGEHICYTLEDLDRGLKGTWDIAAVKKKKVYGKTAIPTGRYQVVMNYSDQFKKYMPLLVGVLGFEGIRIHSGNAAIDTLGCILVGRARGIDQIFGSRIAYADLFIMLKAAETKEKIFITIQ